VRSIVDGFGSRWFFNYDRKNSTSIYKLCDSNNAIEQTSLLFTELGGVTKERADSCIKIR
jgi:hypothetical protein